MKLRPPTRHGRGCGPRVGHMDHMSTAARLAAAVAAALQTADISLRQAEEQTGIPRTTLRRKLRTGAFTVPEIEALASAAGTTAAALVAEAEGKDERATA